MASSGIDVLTYAVCKAYVDKVAGGGSSINVVQTTGSSTEDVMSQDATTKLVYQGGTHPTAIRIGSTIDSPNDDTISIGLNNKVWGQGGISIGANATIGSTLGNGPIAIGHLAGVSADYGIAIGRSANAGVNANNGVALGREASASGQEALALGRNASANAGNSIALGDHAIAYNSGGMALGSYASTGVGNYNIAIGNGASADSSRSGIVCFSKGSTFKYSSYNHSGYMVLAGVHDGQELHDVATVAQGNTLATSAPTTATVGVLGQFYTDTTAMHTYQCTAIDTTDPDNPSYTWTQRW